MNEKVYVVTVTYGDRFHLLKQVIDASFREGVNKIIVVDNASAENSRNQLKQYEEKYRDKLKVIYLSENTGSAGGFKRGLQEAYNDPECEFIWLLDDDNKPLENSLNVLLDFWNSFKIEAKESKIALQSYRFKRGTIMSKKEKIVLTRNSFFEFHLKNIHKKFINFLKRNLFKKSLMKKSIVKIQEIKKILL
ncbi:glycosyltransferase [Caldisericum sp.]|jgi:glycosyltransferase involved in cell wall biosynthesis|uniref:glycosyltransferase n=1 Tax=Caldisericum sp. TaxID=2499687 RepID=UPI003D0E2C23